MEHQWYCPRRGSDLETIVACWWGKESHVLKSWDSVEQHRGLQRRCTHACSFACLKSTRQLDFDGGSRSNREKDSPNLSFAAPAKSYFSTCPPEPRPDWRMALLILNTGVVVHVDLGEIHGHLPSLRLRKRGELASSLNQDPLRLGAHRVALSKSPAPRVLSEPSVRSFGSTSPCAPSDDSLEKHLPPSWTPSTPALREWLRPSVSPSLRLPARASIVSSDEQGLRRRSHVQEGHERHHHLPKPPKPPRRG